MRHNVAQALPRQAYIDYGRVDKVKFRDAQNELQMLYKSYALNDFLRSNALQKALCVMDFPGTFALDPKPMLGDERSGIVWSHEKLGKSVVLQ